MVDEKPRMTADEADARFAALVDQYREEKKPRRQRGPLRVDSSYLAVVIYIVGVLAGVVWRDHVGRALLLGAVCWAVFAIVRKTSRSDE